MFLQALDGIGDGAMRFNDEVADRARDGATGLVDDVHHRRWALSVSSG
jgi:hypothetical protein